MPVLAMPVLAEDFDVVYPPAFLFSCNLLEFLLLFRISLHSLLPCFAPCACLVRSLVFLPSLFSVLLAVSLGLSLLLLLLFRSSLQFLLYLGLSFLFVLLHQPTVLLHLLL